MPGDDDDLARQTALAQTTQQLEPAHARHAEVEEHDVESAAGQPFDGRLGIRSRVDDMP